MFITKIRSKITRQFRIFFVIGLLNTAVDAALFVLFHDQFGWSIVLANIISTSVALSVSYTLNSRYTFAFRDRFNGQSIVRFLAVTLSGAWLIQPLIIIAVLSVLSQINHSFLDGPTSSLIAKLATAAFSMIWNYFWYKHVVFNNKEKATKQ